ncbi:hypothetical protein [Ancylobacter vacuolatus]|uniref:Imidazoleglycerol phosphate synthase glutamine amidotransferase subunit HisH n=1 Tax=Ancylobacter vacuolatus TaxID=223389 RepID=A0ABU0DNG7_9HYPH|nr:hypothetical protein [Ancylobacter vacuolatus]MDQ0349765.1 imidazoleglycerol phosphate synthase glutamine amidotransferase subunit HisH [Ancylobacter vacuolatus]
MGTDPKGAPLVMMARGHVNTAMAEGVRAEPSDPASAAFSIGTMMLGIMVGSAAATAQDPEAFVHDCLEVIRSGVIDTARAIQASHTARLKTEGTA